MKNHYTYEHNGRVGDVLIGHVCGQDFLQEWRQFSFGGVGGSKKISLKNYT
jgi:hypothetical protein